MGIKEGLTKWYIARRIKSWQEAGMGGKLAGGAKTLWQTVNGWKSVILTVLLTVQLWCKGDGCEGPLGVLAGYVDPIIKALGWDPSAAAVAPQAALAALLTLFTFGHAILKAIRDYRAGVPLQHLRSIPVQAVDVKALQG